MSSIGAEPSHARALPDFPATFWGLVEQRAAAAPDAGMLVDDMGRSLTAGEYAAACGQLASALASRFGVGPGSVVTWQLPTTLEAVVLMGALAKLGAVQNPVIPMLRRREVGFITQQVGAQLLVVPGTWRGFDFPAMASEISTERGCEVLVVDHVDGERNGFGLALPTPVVDGDPSAPEPAAPSGDPAAAERWIYYSSGTTADPKGVRHSDRSVMHGATGMIAVLGMHDDDVYPVAFPVAHIGGMSALTAQLMTGALLALSDGFDPERSPAFMASVDATLLGSAIPFFRAYLAAQEEAGPSPLFPRLRACLNGGAPRTLALHRRVRDTLGGCGILSAWGLTEFPIAAMGAVDDTEEQIARTEGRPVPGVVAVAVGSDGADLPPGEEGELVLSGPQMCLGYVDASLDAAAFDGRGRLRTGDLGVIEPSGHVRITGRAKDVIIRNAENLSALEMETVLEQHPDVAEVAVVGVPDERTGERACAVIVAVPGRTAPGLEDVVAHFRVLGVPSQKIPEQVAVVDALPRNSLGKILKRELRDGQLGTEVRS